MLYLLTYEHANNGNYEDSWHGTETVGIYDSLEKAKDVIDCFYRRDCSYANRHVHDGIKVSCMEEYESKEPNTSIRCIWSFGNGRYMCDTFRDFVIEGMDINKTMILKPYTYETLEEDY